MIHTEFYTLTPYTNLLYVESFLSWDEKVSRQFIQDVRELVLKYYSEKAWAVLHDMRQWELGTPEIEQVIPEFLQMELTLMHTHQALVVGNSQIKKWQIENIFKDVSRYEFRLFQLYEDAENWLACFGFERVDPLF